MEIKLKELQGISVVSLTGRIDAVTFPQLEDATNNLIKEGKRKVVINFSGVNYISSGGLRVLLSFTRTLNDLKGVLRFCHLDPNVYKIFKLSGFTTIFNIYETEEEALKIMGQ